MQKQAFSLSTGILSGDLGFKKLNSLSLGVKLYFENTEFTDIDIDAISALASSTRDFITKERKKQLGADLGFAWISVSVWFPNFGMTCHHCLSSNSYISPGKSLEIFETERRSTELHSSWQWSPSLGTFWSSVGLFWDDVYRVFRWEKSAISSGYRIGELNISGALSPARTTWGFSMQRDVYHISLQYAFEKQPAVFESDWKKKLFVSLGGAL